MTEPLRTSLGRVARLSVNSWSAPQCDHLFGSRLALASRPHEKLLHGEGDRLDVRFQREASRIQQRHNRVWVVAPVSLRTCRDEQSIVLTPSILLRNFISFY